MRDFSPKTKYYDRIKLADNEEYEFVMYSLSVEKLKQLVSALKPLNLTKEESNLYLTMLLSGDVQGLLANINDKLENLPIGTGDIVKSGIFATLLTPIIYNEIDYYKTYYCKFQKLWEKANVDIMFIMELFSDFFTLLSNNMTVIENAQKEMESKEVKEEENLQKIMKKSKKK